MADALYTSNDDSRSFEKKKLLPPMHDACDAEQKLFPSKIRSTRYQFTIMIFFGIFLIYAMRTNISIALVDMVKSEESGSENDVNQNCPVGSSQNSSKSDDGTFDWSSSQQANVMGAFYYGYLITQIPAGYVASKIGGKHLFGFGILATGILTMLTPPMSYLGVRWLIGLRFLEGMTEAVTYPSFHHMIGRWAPTFELSIMATLAASGGPFGNLFIQPLVGYLCSVDLLHGWPLGFYAIGALVIIWYIIWLNFAYNNPDEHPRISEDEKSYIKLHSQIDQNQQRAIPWKNILTAVPFWALVVAHVSVNFITYGMMSCMPQYLSNVLNFDIKANGFLSALTWLCCFVSSLLSSNLTDFLRSRRYVTTTFIRKMNQLICTIIPGLFLVLAGYAGCNSTAAVTCIAIGMFFFGFHYSAFICNDLDLAPQFAGIIFSITNTVAAIPGFVAPLVVEFVTRDDVHSEELWRHAFYVFAGVGWTGGLTFMLLGSGKLQPWAQPSSSLTTETFH